MNRHQVLTGAVNAGAHCYAVGSVEGVPFTAYAAGCNVVILASNFQRTQIIPGVHYGNVQVGCLDCSTDIGKIAAAYGKQVYIFEPTPLLNANSSHHLDYHWVQTATISAECYVTVMSWNLEGTRLLIGGEIIQLWHLETCTKEDTIEEEGTNFQLGQEEYMFKTDTEECSKWECVWKCRTAHPVSILKFSPDGTLFASAGHADRLVKIWYENKKVNFTSHIGHSLSGSEINYTFIYIAHPRAVTGFSWRKTSKYMPRASVANMLVTSCRDNICRLWVQTLLPDDGLINLQQIETLASQTPRLHTQRHRQRIMQRLKHMKSFNQYKRRQASQLTEDPHETIPTLPSTYSVHDFHSFGFHGSGIAPGLHFHLAASINAETDIPLVPSMSGGSGLREPNFVLHWINNKELTFTQAAEHLLQEVSQKVLQTEGHESDSEQGNSDDQDVQAETGVKKTSVKTTKAKKSKLYGKQQKSFSYEDLNEDATSKHSFSTVSSSASLATELSNTSLQSPLGDALDRKIESLLREWHQGPDLLFSIHPVDGSLLVWLVDWLDEYDPGSFRQAQVSFSSRIPNAISLSDAATMSHHLSLYFPRAGLDLRVAMQGFHSKETKDYTSQDSPSKINEDKTASSPTKLPVDGGLDHKKREPKSAFHLTTPVVCMLSKHNNGSLNLWHLVFGENTAFTQVLSIGHAARVCGHRFRINDITCHPVLPLLLTTSHHNLPGRSGSGNNSAPVTPSSPSCCPPNGLPHIGFCSELILWKVDPVGPLSKSGGVTELARINSLETAAFANVAWVPTLLPSTTLGNISNSPSACFVASDGQQLRIYQAVIDARTLLAEVSSAKRKYRNSDLSLSSSTSSGLGYRQLSLQETFKIISLQSTSRPGCIIELDSIANATHDWKNTQLLHVFQEQLIIGDNIMSKYSSGMEGKGMGLVEPNLQAVIDLQHSSVFEEPFYLVVLEKNDEGLSVLHMWRLIIASQSVEDGGGQNFTYVPDSDLVQDSDHSNRSSRSNTPEPTGGSSFSSPQAQPLRITTKKVCTEVLPLPEDVDIVHAAPAVGHLSSSNIYPACFAPYLVSTACSDGKVRFWRCEAKETGDLAEPFKYTWLEWEMMLNKTSSAIQVPGDPLTVNCAYSGRMACAYKHGKSFTRPSSGNPHGRYVNISVAIFECESTGGSEWVLEDTIHLKNIGLPQPDGIADLDLGSLYSASVRNRRTVNTFVQKLGSDDIASEHAPNLQRLLSVPSYATLHTLRRTISEQGNQSLLTQKSLVDLDWVSTEDGSHVLTVGVGSKILVFTPVSTEIAEATAEAMNTFNAGGRPALLKQASSMSMIPHHNEEVRWMRLRTTHLTTVDGLPPLPMQLSWVRDGILVVGMDSEMHIYTQWHQCKNSLDDLEQGKDMHKDTEVVVGSRNLVEEELLSRAQETSQLPFSSTSPSGLPRNISSNVLTIGIDSKKKREAQAKIITTNDNIFNDSPLPYFGLFEASRLACPVLPQYHPKQLMELLGFGKISRVKAILSHLVRCISGTGQMKTQKNYLQVPDHFEDNETDARGSPRSWAKSRAFSLAPTSPNLRSPLDPQGSVSVYPEEVQLDYVEITSIPPLPLSTLLDADKEITTRSTPTHTEDGNIAQDYSDLFTTGVHEMEDSLDAILSNSFSLGSKKERQKLHVPERSFLTLFDKRQAHLLTKLLTHTHLPGLSSLDQMHLLALADTVSSFSTTLSDRFNFDQEKQVSAKDTLSNKLDGMNIQALTESLDDCGLRFLLAMRHYTFLLRCLKIAQRAQLQRQGLRTDSLVWAFHSETQEELLQFVPCVQRGNPRWSELREVGVGLWVRSNNTLRKLIEKVSKCAFQAKNDPLDAALFYLAMKKKNIVWGLFRSVGDQKMTAFFQNNFAEDRWRKSALKNAFALLGKQRFEHAAAFFLLAGAIQDAIEVCLNKLNDLQLAMVIVRLYEGDLETTPLNLRRLIYEEILGCDAEGNNYSVSHAHPDPFLRSMAHWLLQDYNGALNTLLQTGVGQSHPRVQDDDEKSSTKQASANPSVFNFYLYLRTHPLVVRRQLAQTVQDKKKARSLMLTGFKYSIDPADQKSALQVTNDIITPLERRLFFTTANLHFRAGCPALALEVLSRLPNLVATDISVLEEGVPPSPDPLLQFKTKNLNHVKSGTLDDLDETEKTVQLDWSQPVTKEDNALDFDWSTPVVSSSALDEPVSFNVLDDSESSSDEESGISVKAKVDTEKVKSSKAEETKQDTKLDIMAQQLKFIACLKIMMEELSTLATGFEVDGGQLRYQLYIWLERGVAALRELCRYGSNISSHISGNENVIGVESLDIGGEQLFSSMTIRWDAESRGENRPTLHEILQADKQDFEAKLRRAYKRKQWLKANETLLRTLLSYCSLHGAQGGGLAAVRMELILLLQELQQDRSQQQLLSPLPFPTTLPLLAASVACQKTVIADPIRHLQAMTHDILRCITEIGNPPSVNRGNFNQVNVLQGLGTALSACIYQSLCDSDNFNVKQSSSTLGTEDLMSSSVVFHNSHLLAGYSRRHRYCSDGSDPLIPNTAPSKWPGVQSLRALLARDKDEDSPKLHTLLSEAFFAVYLSHLVYGLATCDCQVLYRLVGLNLSEKTWAMLYGGGAKRLLHVATSGQHPLTSSSSEKSTPGEEGLLNTLSKQRMKLHMKLLGQLGQSTAQATIKEDRPTYREQFVPPEMSMVSCFMSKPELPEEYQPVDYDSSESLPSDDDDDDEEEDEVDGGDVFGDFTENTTGAINHAKKSTKTSKLDQLDPSSYSWEIMRYAILKLVHCHMLTFLGVAGIDLPELPVSSPMIHSVLRTLELWLHQVKMHMESFGSPPPHYLPECFVESNQGGPAIQKYKALLELQNTPFRSQSSAALPAKRLWNFLVRQEPVQDIFIRYIFSRRHAHVQENSAGQDTDSVDYPTPDLVRVIHKDQDSITTFCVSKINAGTIALATPKEIQELDISLLLEPTPWLEDEAEFDILNLEKPPELLPASDFLVVQHPSDRGSGSSGYGLISGAPNSVGGSSYNSPTGPAPPQIGIQTGRGAAMSIQNRRYDSGNKRYTLLKGHHFPGSSNPKFCQFVIERSRHLLKPLKRHRTDGVRKMCAHPLLPLYLSGAQDGSLQMWEWGHQQGVSSPRQPGTFAKVTNVLFNVQGNKFGVTDGDGNLSLWQVGLSNVTAKPFFSAQCHSKQVSDFAFVSSSSLIATAGHSAENKNICLWDTLLPQRKAMVSAFICHEQGSSAVVYAPQQQVLISAGKKGDICIFDVRQRQLRHRFQAHDSPIKCLALDPGEEYFVTGSADGDIKVWGLSVHILFYSFLGEHSRSTLFRNIGMGVSQVYVDSAGRLFSCGADGSMKLRQLPDRDSIINFYN
ncbi:dmX-like protein 2 isoform X5 [Limulus polyphemus]|uniref:DmX-like protein 2 isoform X5 n=1 Tax=Limulus polyphemus TaxID=6850 RepID=A0ABM1TPF1_LIMPO|nr:dmX-like protein 2 isoform X5 [Limulus polyphemus]